MSRVLEQFQRLNKAVIDSSSVIYMKKSGFFDIVRNNVDLCTIPEVIVESGYDDLDLKMCSIQEGHLSVDEKVVACAREGSCAVISEDRKVLRAAEQQGLPYFNALVVLHYLLFKKIINETQHHEYQKVLLEFARYGPEVINKGEEIYKLITSNEKKGVLAYGKGRP